MSQDHPLEKDIVRIVGSLRGAVEQHPMLRNHLRELGQALQRLADGVSPSQVTAFHDGPASEPLAYPSCGDPGLTLQQVADLYREKIQDDIRSREISCVHGNRRRASLSAMLSRLDGTAPMAQLGYEKVATLVAQFKDRATNGYAPDTVLNFVWDLRNFLRWAEEAGLWRPTFAYDKLCRVKKHKLITLQESRELSLGQDIFTPAELAKIYAVASQTNKLYLLLGLNLAATQQQIADLFLQDIHLDAKPPYVEFIRSKTRHCGQGTLAYYELWPETAELLGKRIKRTPKTAEGWALLTKDGNRMLYYNAKNGRCDPIYMAWKKLLDKARVPEDRRLTFKFLRKTISDMVLRLSDEYTQQQMLAHTRRTIASRHYTGRTDFSKLSLTLRRVRQELLYEMFGLPAPAVPLQDKDVPQ